MEQSQLLIEHAFLEAAQLLPQLQVRAAEAGAGDQR